MGKRLSNLHAWHWRGYADNQQIPSTVVLHVIAVALFILGALLITDGVISFSIPSLTIGVIGLIAARGIERSRPAL